MIQTNAHRVKTRANPTPRILGQRKLHEPKIRRCSPNTLSEQVVSVSSRHKITVTDATVEPERLCSFHHIPPSLIGQFKACFAGLFYRYLSCWPGFRRKRKHLLGAYPNTFFTSPLWWAGPGLGCWGRFLVEMLRVGEHPAPLAREKTPKEQQRPPSFC